ncbi:ankyrin repeat domain-containing protein 17-like [Haliotis rubra]|uniref:ankyrin repeat domain-containing protein 17-like n=1 Tax=Haliotis rubra TaxID=36100 RepID=UPI001EE5AA1D|nr:ankyrin repeat domain-containing protein 17-like [Haliotis rubra]XP_046582159.1 ankyrin repeat domain-containing protein 17-like [Haliotis rubra]XP_046582160.1 ankyrin repeat domain-containing protein 17-like [Haliotis rubra]
MGQCCSKVHIDRLNVAGYVHGGVGHDNTADTITGGIANEGTAEHPDNGSVTVKIGCDDQGITDSIPRVSTDNRNKGNIPRDSTNMGNTPHDSTEMGNIPRDSTDMGNTPCDSTDMGNESTRHTSGDREHQESAKDIRHPNAQTPKDSWTLNSTMQAPVGGEGVSFHDIDMLNLEVVRVAGDDKRVHCLPLADIVDINMSDQIGKTPLIVAAWKGRQDVFGFLVGRGADESVTDAYSNNILHWACHGGDVGMVQFIVSERLVDIDSRGKDRYTPVMMAAERRHKDVVTLLVQAGCNMSHVTNGGNNILHVTCACGDITTVKYILSKNSVNINSSGMNERTAAMIAALRGHRAVFELLVSEGCDLSPVTHNNNNILHEACVGGDVGIVNYIVSTDIVDINSRGKYDRTPVMVAAEFGHIDVLELLVREGGDVNLRSDAGNTILHAACLGGYVKVVSHVLTTTHVDINAQGIQGRTPLMLAAWKGHQDVFELLVSAGSDVSLVDDGGNNILHVACRGGHVEMVTYLLSKKLADSDATDKQGSTAIMIAKEKKHKAVVDVLSSKVKLPSD